MQASEAENEGLRKKFGLEESSTRLPRQGRKATRPLQSCAWLQSWGAGTPAHLSLQQRCSDPLPSWLGQETRTLLIVVGL